MTNLEGLGNLTTIEGDIHIHHNNSISSLTGLDSINAASVNGLYITENISLSSCAVKGICDYLVSPSGAVEIWNNAPGCNSQEEVEEDCGCLPEGIIFDHQTQIDSFPINYPQCPEIMGYVTISGKDITNLNGLNSLNKIGRYLKIEYNPSLTNLTGLDNLGEIGNDLSITSNNNLSQLTGLEGLTSVGGGIVINNNDVLEYLTGLNKLESVEGYITISMNPILISLLGLEELKEAGGLNINNNPLLEDLTPLSNLTTLLARGPLWIYKNEKLQSLSGLENIDPESVYGLSLYDNDTLCLCGVQSICDFLDDPNGTIEIP